MRFVAVAAVASLQACIALGQAPRHLDLLIALNSGSNSSVYIVDPASGEVRGLLSGTPGWPTFPRGLGAPLSQSWCSVVATRDGRIFASGSNNSKPAVAQIDPISGDRTALGASWESPFNGAATIALRDQTSLVVSGQQTTGARLGTLHSVSLTTGSAAPLAGGLLTEGPGMAVPISFALCSRELFVAADFLSGPVTGLATFEINLQSMSQRLLTNPSNSTISRYVVSAGQASPSPVAFSPFGTGPFCGQSSHPIGYAGGRVYFSAISQRSGGYIGGVVQIDPATGSRELILGSAIDAANQVVYIPPSSGLSDYNALPSAFFDSPTGELFIGEWDPTTRIVAFDPRTRSARVVVDFAAYFAPAASFQRVRGITLYTNCPADINLDGFADDSDFTHFVGAYDILDCADGAMPVPCPSDLNADGLVDDSDFQIFVAGYDALVCD